ncbi:hypothetical protein ACFXTN_022310 [Malus domestica]
MAAGSVPSHSTFFSDAVTSTLHLLLRHSNETSKMDSDNLWSSLFSTSSSRRYQSRSDLLLHEETDGDDELKAEFLCPFCAEDFDVVGFCYHIDEEHPVEAKNGAFCSISPFLV